jgi:hypothetical protein
MTVTLSWSYTSEVWPGKPRWSKFTPHVNPDVLWLGSSLRQQPICGWGENTDNLPPEIATGLNGLDTRQVRLEG